MIDKEKKYTTRDGHPVRIYETDCGSHYPVHGAVFRDGAWEMCVWTQDGRRHHSCIAHDWDLFEDKPRMKGWMNCYQDRICYLYPTREGADKNAGPGRVACIEIDVPHGYGLEETT